MILKGDCISVMKAMKSNSIDMCLTSPPYWGLRDYGVEGQLGLEKTPEEYIEKMIAVFHEVKRVLKKEGTLWLNMGDTYFGSGCGTNDYRTPASISLSKPELYDGPRPQNTRQHQYLKPKCLCMIPERLAWSMIQDGWILRNKIIWYKPNPMPSSVKDRLSNTWEYVYLLAKSKRYYFDLDAVREAHKEGVTRWGGNVMKPTKKTKYSKDDRKTIYCRPSEERLWRNPGGKNPGDHWSINTQPFPDAHFAVFPEKLCEKLIKAGCPKEVCKKCGKARERISKRLFDPGREKTASAYPEGSTGLRMQQRRQAYRKYGMENAPPIETIGWTSCNCNAGFEGGIVLDPFCGAGTALYVAKEMRRRYIGIDIKQEYCDMSKKRLAQGVL